MSEQISMETPSDNRGRAEVLLPTTIPRGFRVDDQGLWRVKMDDSSGLESSTFICSRLDVIAYTRDENGETWGRLLQFNDPERGSHRWAMPMSLLAGDGQEIRRKLLGAGVKISPEPGPRKDLLRYLQNAEPSQSLRCVSKLGWHGSMFVLPDVTFGPKGEEPVIYQTESESKHALNVQGTIQDWIDNVGRRCTGNSRLVFGVSAAFAAPLLQPVEAESGGFHSYGQSSIGKTTQLAVAGSVWGGGTSPAGYMNTWRATANGIEATAEQHTDRLLILDELAEIQPEEASQVAYMLGNGVGKQRMTQTTASQRRPTWNSLFLSSGEITVADHIQPTGKRVRAGMETRLINIAADAGAGMGIFESLHGAVSPEAFSRELKEAAKQYYGSPIRAFLVEIVERKATIKSEFASYRSQFLQSYVPPDASGEVIRGAQRFALIAYAGELATKLGLTGWTKSEATVRVSTCLWDWIESRGTTGPLDAEEGVRQVRAFIEANGSSRFQAISGEGQRIYDRVGFRQDSSGASEYWILPDAFRTEICRGFEYAAVAHALAERGHLRTESGDDSHLTIRRNLPELGQKRVYAIKASVLDAE